MHVSPLPLGLRALPPTTLLLLLTPACKSPAGYRADADREVYEIVRERRDELAAGGEFTIDLPEDTLRRRILQGAEVEPLGLGDCLAVAAENSREYQRRREALYLVALDLTLERWNFSVQENGTFGAFLARESGRQDTAGVLSNFGIAKLLGTGLSIVGDIGIDLVRDVSSGDGWDAVSNLSLNITQPLLRGFGRDIVLEPLTQAERDVLYEARTYERFRRTFAFDVAARFFRILQQEDTLRNEEQNFRNLTQLRERNEAFAEAGQLNDIQVDQARQDELSAQNSVIGARQRLATLLDEFKLFLGLPIETSIELAAGDSTQLETWAGLLEIDLDEAVAVDVALSERLDYRTAVDLVEDAGRGVHVAADALRAGLDLTASADATSEAGRPLDVRGDAIRWEIGAELDLPIDRLPERNAYRTRLILLDVAQRQEEETADTITSDVRAGLRDLRAARESYEIQRGAVALAERRVESAALNLEAGRAETRDVLEAQESLVGAQNSATRALTEYILSGIVLYVDMELLRVTEDGIEIEEGPLLARIGGPRP